MTSFFQGSGNHVSGNYGDCASDCPGVEARLDDLCYLYLGFCDDHVLDHDDGVFFRAMEWSMVFEKKPL